MLDNIGQWFILTSMRTAKTISITLPPDLLLKARKTAEREDRTVSELFREALRRYITADPEWDALLRRTQATGKALGTVAQLGVHEVRHAQGPITPATVSHLQMLYLGIAIYVLEPHALDPVLVVIVATLGHLPVALTLAYPGTTTKII